MRLQGRLTVAGPPATDRTQKKRFDHVFELVARLVVPLPWQSRLSFGERLRLADFGPVTGFVAILVHVVQFLLFVLVAVFRPVCIIERAPDFPLRAFNTKSGRIHPCAAERAARG